MTRTAASPASWTVLFDWNGTLVDDVGRSHSAICAVLESRGLPALRLAEFRDRFRLPLSALFADLGIPGAAGAAAQAQWNAIMAGLPAPLRHGAVSTLASLAERCGVLGVISAASAEAVTSDMRATGVADLFHVVLGGVADKSEALRPFVAHRSVPHVAYVGDTEHDMSSARRAGALAIGVTGGYRPALALREAGAQHLVAELDQIPSLLTAATPERPFRRQRDSRRD